MATGGGSALPGLTAGRNFSGERGERGDAARSLETQELHRASVVRLSAPYPRVHQTGNTGPSPHTSSSRIASPQGVMISVAPQFRPALRITPAGTAKA